jgi:fluoroquinolone transport system permease protein
MRPRTVALIRHDVRLQYRYGIYAAYAVIVAVYLAELLLFRDALPIWVPALIIFTDPAAVAFFFLGALMMLEKSEGVRVALSASPATAVDYLTGKAVTLVGLSLVSSAALLPFIPHATNPLLLLVAVALTAVQYLGIGVPIALRFKTVNGYLIGSAGFLTPVIAPGLLALLEPFPLWLAIVPAVSQFRLMLVATGAASATAIEVATTIIVLAAAAIGAMAFALHVLRREFGK